VYFTGYLVIFACSLTALLVKLDFPEDYRDSFVLIDHAKPYIKSTAFIHISISKKLRMPWPLFSLTAVIPRNLRDFVYNTIGKTATAGSVCVITAKSHPRISITKYLTC